MNTPYKIQMINPPDEQFYHLDVLWGIYIRYTLRLTNKNLHKHIELTEKTCLEEFDALNGKKEKELQSVKVRKTIF